MSTQPFDPTKYKAGQREEWSQVAEAWRKWWPFFERGAQRVSDRLGELASVQQGQRVLDISTGIGEPAATLSGLVGPDGSIVATDQSPGMLAIAQQRIEELGLSNVSFVEVDTEEIDFTKEEFDAIVCHWGLMFLPNLSDSLARIRRSLKTGGKFATSVWSTRDKVAFANFPMNVAQRVLDPPPSPPPPSAPNIFKLGAPGVIESEFEKAGFANVRIERLNVEISPDYPEEFTDFLKDVSPPIRTLISQRSPEVQEAYWKAVTEGVREFAGPDGRIRMPSETILVVGTR